MITELLFTCLRFLPSTLRLRIYDYCWWLGIRLYGPTDFFVQRLPGNIYMKRGTKALQEAEAIRIVKARTSIPVPTVLDALDGCFIMTRLPGEPLGNLFSEMEGEQLSAIQNSLSSIIQQLRDITSDEKGVVSGPLHSLPCCDINRVDELAFGPFHDVAEFHEYLLSRTPPQYQISARAKAAKAYARPFQVVFTHGDLNLRNILVKDRQITGIVDWTCAGWYPEYWEHGKAIYVHRRFKKWLDVWSNILPNYEDVLDVEKEMWKTCSF
ncbi:hypothetical protein E1B28_010325 [Marasmius oreades]|uniref:Aminoglycoside phosphotransferase domain-containing protein n=1 Tax=Marasmius oreades TaxID=181124 RepID=A0A9P7USK6_9AGAR|nr:uncharacterized protein E1B28_010325 [Marasmius oreades]KAG7091276.1 hypothetical protein E1B28_010325 [Marasmius oreades]